MNAETSLSLPYQPLDPDPELPELISVNIAEAPELSFEDVPEFVSPNVAAHVEAARTKGVTLFKTTPSAVHHVRKNAVPSFRSAVPKDLIDALSSPDPEVKRVFSKHYRQSMAQQVEEKFRTFDEQLAKAELEHEAALSDLPSRRVTPSDLHFVHESILSWKVIPAKYLVPVLRRELIDLPIKEERYGRIVAALPALRSLIEEGKDTPEMRQCVREMEIVARGAEFYQHKTALTAARQTRFKLAALAKDVLAYDGQLDKVPGIGVETKIWNRTIQTEMKGYYAEFAGLEAA